MSALKQLSKPAGPGGDNPNSSKHGEASSTKVPGFSSRTSVDAKANGSIPAPRLRLRLPSLETEKCMKHALGIRPTAGPIDAVARGNVDGESREPRLKRDDDCKHPGHCGEVSPITHVPIGETEPFPCFDIEGYYMNHLDQLEMDALFDINLEFNSTMAESGSQTQGKIVDQQKNHPECNQPMDNQEKNDQGKGIQHMSTLQKGTQEKLPALQRQPLFRVPTKAASRAVSISLFDENPNIMSQEVPENQLAAIPRLPRGPPQRMYKRDGKWGSEVAPQSEPWPPVHPDVTKKQVADMMKHHNLTPGLAYIGKGGESAVFAINDQIVYKETSNQREFNMFIDTNGATPVPFGRVMELRDGKPVMTGMLMERCEKFIPQQVPPSERMSRLHEMQDIICQLHETAGIIHGDIKPDNFVIDNQGKLRIIDFGTAYIPGEKHWTSLHSPNYTPPDRYNRVDPLQKWHLPAPTAGDDIYAVGLCALAMWRPEHCDPIRTVEFRWIRRFGILHRYVLHDIDHLVNHPFARFFIKMCLRQGRLHVPDTQG